MKSLPMIPDAPPDPSGSVNERAELEALVADDAKTAELKPAIVDAIRTVYDPEIPVNIWELGLIYDIIVNAAGIAGVRMTLTAPGCPAAQSLPVEVADKVKAVSGVSDAKVDVVWEPPWTKDRMSDVAKLELGMW
jgi:FeS assembly SUF system protein